MLAACSDAICRDGVQISMDKKVVERAPIIRLIASNPVAALDSKFDDRSDPLRYGSTEHAVLKRVSGK
jgi:hypothetical protein